MFTSYSALNGMLKMATLLLMAVYVNGAAQPKFRLMMRKDKTFSRSYEIRDVEVKTNSADQYYFKFHAFKWHLKGITEMKDYTKGDVTIKQVLLKMGRRSKLNFVNAFQPVCNRWLILDHEGLKFLRFVKEHQQNIRKFKANHLKINLEEYSKVKLEDALPWWRNTYESYPEEYHFEYFKEEVEKEFCGTLDADKETFTKYVQKNWNTAWQASLFVKTKRTSMCSTSYWLKKINTGDIKIIEHEKKQEQKRRKPFFHCDQVLIKFTKESKKKNRYLLLDNEGFTFLRLCKNKNVAIAAPLYATVYHLFLNNQSKHRAVDETIAEDIPVEDDNDSVTGRERSKAVITKLTPSMLSNANPEEKQQDATDLSHEKKNQPEPTPAAKGPSNVSANEEPPLEPIAPIYESLSDKIPWQTKKLPVNKWNRTNKELLEPRVDKGCYQKESVGKVIYAEPKENAAELYTLSTGDHIKFAAEQDHDTEWAKVVEPLEGYMPLKVNAMTPQMQATAPDFSVGERVEAKTMDIWKLATIKKDNKDETFTVRIDGDEKDCVRKSTDLRKQPIQPMEKPSNVSANKKGEKEQDAADLSQEKKNEPEPTPAAKDNIVASSTTTCSKCNGKGKTGVSIFSKKCKVCGGTGTVSTVSKSRRRLASHARRLENRPIHMLARQIQQAEA